MGLSFWIYIIIAIVFAIIRQMKKSAKGPDGQPRTPEYDQSDNKPMTFEELLREIQASKNPSLPPAPTPVYTKTEYSSVEAKSLETISTTNDSHSFELYEKAKREAFQRPSLEETLKLGDTVMKYSHFKEYDESAKRTVALEVMENFKDPEGFKKAFIMSEILKRKF